MKVIFFRVHLIIITMKLVVIEELEIIYFNLEKMESNWSKNMCKI